MPIAESRCAFEVDGYKKILVINLMHLGDLMLVTPVLRTLRTNFPTAEIDLLADKKLSDLVVHNRWIDRCLLIDKKGVDDHLPSFIKFIMKIRAEQFDLVINLHRNERASALAAWSGAKKIVGYSKPFFSVWFDQVLPNLKAVKHQIHSHFDVLRQAVGIERIDDGGLEMWIEPSIEKEMSARIEKEFGSTKVIALNIGASWLTKRWIDDYFAECADRLIERGYGIAFLGGPTDVEIVERCVEKMRHKDSDRLKIFTGRLTLAQVAGLLDQCVLFLTTDSGPMHIGVARNIPIVTMFGASPVPGFYPYDAKDILIKTPEPCHPCGKHECPRSGAENMACMKNIPVDVVMKYVDELLSEYGQRAKEIPRVYGAYQCRVVEL